MWNAIEYKEGKMMHGRRTPAQIAICSECTLEKASK